MRASVPCKTSGLSFIRSSTFRFPTGTMPCFLLENNRNLDGALKVTGPEEMPPSISNREFFGPGNLVPKEKIQRPRCRTSIFVIGRYVRYNSAAKFIESYGRRREGRWVGL